MSKPLIIIYLSHSDRFFNIIGKTFAYHTKTIFVNTFYLCLQQVFVRHFMPYFIAPDNSCSRFQSALYLCIQILPCFRYPSPEIGIDYSLNKCYIIFTESARCYDTWRKLDAPAADLPTYISAKRSNYMFAKTAETNFILFRKTLKNPFSSAMRMTQTKA